MIYGQESQEEPTLIKKLRDISVMLNPDNKVGRKTLDIIGKLMERYPKTSVCVERIEMYLKKHPEAVEPWFAHLYDF